MRHKRIYKIIFLFVFAALIATTVYTQQKTILDLTDPTSPLLNQGPKKEAVGEKFMVSTQLASSTMAAVQVL